MNILSHELRTPLGTARNVVRHTSRQIGKEEQNGDTYHFVTSEEFELMVREGQFIEYHKFYPGYYGTTKTSIQRIFEEGSVPILDLDTLAATDVANALNDIGIPVLRFFISPVSRELLLQPDGLDRAVEVIKERIKLRARGFDLDEEVIRHRTEHARICLQENIANPLLIENMSGNLNIALEQIRTIVHTFITELSKIDNGQEWEEDLK